MQFGPTIFCENKEGNVQTKDANVLGENIKIFEWTTFVQFVMIRKTLQLIIIINRNKMKNDKN